MGDYRLVLLRYKHAYLGKPGFHVFTHSSLAEACFCLRPFLSQRADRVLRSVRGSVRLYLVTPYCLENVVLINDKCVLKVKFMGLWVWVWLVCVSGGLW